jgi:phosphohistidine phosphatase
MKRIYFVRHAKAESFSEGISDYERGLRKKGKKDAQMIGSYLKLHDVKIDIILSSCALRAQESAMLLAEKLDFSGEKYFLEELYYASDEEVLKIITAQDDTCENILIVGHNPQLNELINRISREHISKIPTMGVVALEFDTQQWTDVDTLKGKVDFFIYPKQFHYYMPKQIRTNLIQQ